MPDKSNKHKGLGRGLSQLFGEAAAAYGAPPPPDGGVISAPPSGNGRSLPIASLRPGPSQPRRHFDETALAELADSIRVHGVLQPILVRTIDGHPHSFEIVAGERRWRAAQKAALHEVPVVIRSLSDSEALEIALIENLQRQDLTALEEAEGYQRLIDEFNHSHGALAELVGKSRPHIANMLRLLGLPATVKRLVQDGLLSAGHARALLGAPDIEALAKVVVARGLSVRDTERLANAAKTSSKPTDKGKKTGGKGHKSADLLALEHDLEQRLGLKVSIESQGKAGSITIQYHSLDQLDGIIARLELDG